MNTFDAYRKMTEDHLEPELLSLGSIPDRIREPMLYSLLSEAKRLRPVLLLASAEMSGASSESAMPFACALEMIHTYSLIHDDLPAMDNDDMRRHQPSCHIAYGEDMAILAGDGLLSAACELMLKGACTFRDLRGARAAYAIMRRAGVCGMVAGQTVDVTMEGKPVERETVSYIHTHKTADLITAGVEAGLILGGAPEEIVEKGIAYGQHLGLAFQMVDDLLDAVGDSSVMGKKTGLDAAEGKQTWVALRGIEGTREDVLRETDAAQAAIRASGYPEEKTEFFAKLARTLAERVQ